MRLKIAALLALTVPCTLAAQTTSIDLSTATPLAGAWTYAAVAGGTEATFANASSQPQLTIRCIRAARQIAIAKPASGAAPFLSVWTSTAVRNVPASFDPATARISINLTAYDALLDALAFSRGRIGVAVSGLPALIAPAGPEIARVVEDCRG